MIELTRRKLDEARFFYQHLLKERQQKTYRHDPRAFRFYFSAFIQAARSVTWTLGKEETEKWKAWRPKWESTLTDEDKRLMAFTNKLRQDEVHHGGTNPTVMLEEVELHELLSANLSGGSWHPAYYQQLRRRLPGVPSSKVFRPAYYFEGKDGKEEVTVLCKRYLDFLEKMLNDFCAENYPALPQ